MVDAVFKMYTVLPAIMEIIGILDLFQYKWIWSTFLTFAEDFTSLLLKLAPQLCLKLHAKLG